MLGRVFRLRGFRPFSQPPHVGDVFDRQPRELRLDDFRLVPIRIVFRVGSSSHARSRRYGHSIVGLMPTLDTPFMPSAVCNSRQVAPWCLRRQRADRAGIGAGRVHIADTCIVRTRGPGCRRSVGTLASTSPTLYPAVGARCAHRPIPFPRCHRHNPAAALGLIPVGGRIVR